jgi:hypothetical protein
MPVLPDDRNPFARPTLYDELDIRPYADSDELNQRLQQVAVQLEKLPESERKHRSEILQDASKTLRGTRLRVLVNAMLLDPINSRRLTELLRQLGELTPDQLQLPELDISQVVIEGESIEMAQQDFKPVSEEPSLMIALQGMAEMASKRTPEKHFHWDL